MTPGSNYWLAPNPTLGWIPATPALAGACKCRDDGWRVGGVIGSGNPQLTKLGRGGRLVPGGVPAFVSAYRHGF